MQRRLGFMSMSAIRSLVSGSVGLETLVDVPWPKNFIDENSMMGKAIDRDKPDSAQARCSAPLELSGGIFLVLASQLLLVAISIVQSLLITILGTVRFTCSKIRLR